MFKFYKPTPMSKSQQQKAEKAKLFTHEVVCCNKCGATHTTLRKLPLRGEMKYYCEECIKRAMKEQKDVRED